MAEEQEGIVLFVEGNIAKVRSSRHSHCENCGSCPGNTAIIIDSLNSVNACVGERVVIKIKEKNMLKAAFVVFVLPLLAAFCGAFLGSNISFYFDVSNALTIQVLSGVLFFGAAVAYVKIFERKVSENRETKAVIIRKL